MQFDLEQLPARERYKLVVSTVTPRPIAWVVSQDAAGTVNAAPFSFFNAFSDDPVVVAIGVGPRAPGAPKDTGANIKATGEFTVCLVSEETIHGMNITAIDFPPGTDELKEAGLSTVPSLKVRTPRIAESPVAFECVTHQIIPIGHHDMILGRVVSMYIRDDCVLDPAKNYVDTPKLGLLGRMHGRGWYVRNTDRIEVPRLTVAEWEARRKG
ncbi:flavin reductase family protein [Roseomonas sp. NAR14]|uniref:Flavin reductase family protein n=1 Tax=Roseomonas acroporae TaxID=2937791 RepID=A0A9X1Y598_9PROT|nr:flavin reductase family protein [Roseomonas acroporae]MCK8783310.1 flavin reductase family protein [Roseomonas acroporae]